MEKIYVVFSKRGKYKEYQETMLVSTNLDLVKEVTQELFEQNKGVDDFDVTIEIWQDNEYIGYLAYDKKETVSYTISNWQEVPVMYW